MSSSLLHFSMKLNAVSTFFLLFFRAEPAPYGSSQARGGIGAVAAAYATHTAMLDPSGVCDLHHRSLVLLDP